MSDLRTTFVTTLKAHLPVSVWVNYAWRGHGCSCGVMAEDFRQHLADVLTDAVEGSS